MALLSGDDRDHARSARPVPVESVAFRARIGSNRQAQPFAPGTVVPIADELPCGPYSNMQIALATDSSVPELDPDNASLLEALRKRGARAVPVVWDDPRFDWSPIQICVVRATYDYVLHRERFLNWAEAVSTQTLLLNCAETLRWNSHKRYLLELEQRGAPVVPSLLIGRNERVDLKRLMEERGWSRLVVKPAVSASGRETFLVESDDSSSAQARLDRLLEREDLLLQPFMPGVQTEGEISIVYIDGHYSHAVRLKPRAGDFRVQAEFGGTKRRVSPRTAELLVADHVLEAGPADALYARIDLVTDGAGEIRLGELELVEPCLHLRLCPDAAVRLADAILARL